MKVTVTAVAHTLTIDFECWPQIAYLYATGRVRNVGGEALTRQTDRILGLLDSHGVKATFFVLGATASAWPDLILQISDAGHEIACHGYRHQRACDQTASELAYDIRRGLDTLEAITSVRPRGYRAPEFSINASSLWALDVIADQGMAYDSSIFPIAGRRYGIPSWPRTRQRVARGRLVELPIATTRALGVNLPIAGGGYWRLLPKPVLLRSLAALTRRDERAVLYLHPFELDDRDPAPITGPLDWRQRLFARRFHRLQCTGRRSVFGKLDSVLGRHRWQTALEAAESTP